MLPRGFTRIRHYGFLGNAVRHANLPVIREHLGMKAPEPATETPVERIARVYSIDLHACPGCAAGKLEPFGMLQPRPARGPPPE